VVDGDGIVELEVVEVSGAELLEVAGIVVVVVDRDCSHAPIARLAVTTTAIN
jgi:hypothetical protein